MNQVATVEKNELANVAQLPVDASQSDKLMAAIVTATSDPSTDVAKMEAMYDLYSRVRAHDAELAYKKAMAATQAEIPRVIKNKRNTQTNSNYADLGAVLDAVLPIAGANGLSMSFRPEEAPEGYVKVVGISSHADGHSIEFPLVMPLDGAGLKGNANKTPIHAKSSAMAYCERYITVMVYSVATGDNDGNTTRRVPLITAEQAESLKLRLMDTESNVQQFCQVFKVENVDSLKAADYARADAMLTAKEKNNADN